MSKILIVGNVLKDVYLKLDERQNEFEQDEHGIDWLELGFNGGAHSFFRRTSVYGGAAVSLAVLSKLGIDAGILNSKSEIKSGEIIWANDPSGYRYILSHKGGITYFVPSERKPTDWSMPSGRPEWILVDRSTVVSARLVDELKNFTDEKIVDKIELDKPNTQLVCHISPRKLYLSDAEESWSLDRTDMMTHLTIYSTIVATILGVIAVGGTPADALLWAKLNAENATLESVLSAEELQELATEEVTKRADL